MKKIFLLVICFCALMNISDTTFSREKKADIKPLKLEQSYEYGKFEKNFKNPNLKDEDDFSKILNKEKTKEPSVLRIFNSLIFVILLILLTGWVYMKFKKINPEQLLSGKFNKLNENNFKIVSSLQLGAGKAVYLIEINNRQLVIGTTSTNVNLLAQIDKTENEQNEIPPECIEKLFDKKDD